MTFRVLCSTAAAALDAELMPSLYALEQLMELAGGSVALAAVDSFPAETFPRVLVLAGPGNNGGDGLVAARHLHGYGYSPEVFCPKPSSSEHYVRLLSQCRALQIPTSEQCPPDFANFDFIIDAILGFSSKLPLRMPFVELVKTLGSTHVPILSIDVPTGWSVDDHLVPDGVFIPSVLVSLTAPKPCALAFEKVVGGDRRHYLGLGCGVLPPCIAKKYDVAQMTPTPRLGGIVRLK